MIVICIDDNLFNFTLKKQYTVIRSIYSQNSDISYYEIKNDQSHICFINKNSFIPLKDYRRTKIKQIQNI